jgi:uncharacterized protein YdhG (YjbR/CyaY superfamily)
MLSKATTPNQYIAELPQDKSEVLKKLRQTILENLPEGFEEAMAYGMLGYVVPHSIYPNGYHCNPKLPLGIINIASQKNFVALYHMAIYLDMELFNWFVESYPKHCKTKLDMGKSCIRFKKIDDIPYDLIAELIRKISVQQWITMYESVLKK